MRTSPESAGAPGNPAQYRQFVHQTASLVPEQVIEGLGSNNWVIGGAMTTTGRLMVMNDPHREVMHPSPRYNVHLNGPGWNIVGSGEPPFIGVALGHNERLAWGLTITGTDQQDVFVEEINPANPAEMKYNGAWEPLRTVHDEIKVKGEPSRMVELKFSRHGPIFYEDKVHHRAYALKSALNEPGTAFYLGSLRIAQTQNCREFLDAAMYWKAPSHNLICGDVDGNIAWQPSALTPVRTTGWDAAHAGHRSARMARVPKGSAAELNPAAGSLRPRTTISIPKYWPPLMFKTTNGLDFARITRLRQLRARQERIDRGSATAAARFLFAAPPDQPVFRGWAATTPTPNGRGRCSAADGYSERKAPKRRFTRRGAAWRIKGAEQRDVPAVAPAVEAGLQKAVERLTRTQGADWTQWRSRMHTSVPALLASEFDLPAVERSGGAGGVRRMAPRPSDYRCRRLGSVPYRQHRRRVRPAESAYTPTGCPTGPRIVLPDGAAVRPTKRRHIG